MGRAVPVGRKGDPLYDSDQESAEMQANLPDYASPQRVGSFAFPVCGALLVVKRIGSVAV